jgi:hypothetical protein
MHPTTVFKECLFGSINRISGICLGFSYCFAANIILTDVTIKVTLKT